MSTIELTGPSTSIIYTIVDEIVAAVFNDPKQP
jgi:hypothetical protein